MVTPGGMNSHSRKLTGALSPLAESATIANRASPSSGRPVTSGIRTRVHTSAAPVLLA